MTLPDSSPGGSSSSADSTTRFIGLATLGVLVVSLCAARAPLELKKPGLSLPLLGLAIGWGIARWAATCGIRSQRFVSLIAAVLVAAGVALSTVDSHRIAIAPGLATWKRYAAEKNPLAERIRNSLSQPADAKEQPASPEEIEAGQAMLAELDKSQQVYLERLEAERQNRFGFAAYLRQRIPESWGNWPTPLPTLFWLGEVLGASLLGAVVAAKMGGGQS